MVGKPWKYFTEEERLKAKKEQAKKDGKKHYTFHTENFWTFTVAENFTY